jgi:hypothetical protein
MDISGQPNFNTSEEVLCEIAEQYSQSVLITVVQYCHITMSSLALLALASNLPLSFLWHKKLGVHLNLKVNFGDYYLFINFLVNSNQFINSLCVAFNFFYYCSHI